MLPERLAPESRGLPSGVLLALLAVWLLCTLGVRPLMLPDEGRYTTVAWEMLRGDPLVPTLYGLPYFHKPPLTYWINRTAIDLFGPQEFATRVAPALGAWLMGVGLWWEVRVQQGLVPAQWALAVLATMPFFFLGAQFANHDMLVAGCITLSVVCARQAARPTGTLRWVVGAWMAAAAGVLAKGLIGIVLPLLVVLPVLLWRRDQPALVRLLHPSGWLVFALLVLPWFVEMERRFPGFFDYFIVEQHFRRYATAGFNNPQPFWFFPAALGLLALPWTLWTVPAVRKAWPIGKSSVNPDLRDASFNLWWLTAVVAFFTWPRSKLAGYVLPALPPLAVLLASAVQARPLLRRWVLGGAALTCLGLVAGMRQMPPTSHRDIGQSLQSHRRMGEEVLFIDGHFFDVPFYARLEVNPHVWSEWDDPALPLRDHWRKELHDAARFDDQAARVLVRTRELPGLLCSGKPLWIVAAPGFQAPSDWPEIRVVTKGRNANLWRARVGGGTICG
ncbi:MAG: ArnT family glycosyltransferase [Rubrivivax sp.]